MDKYGEMMNRKPIYWLLPIVWMAVIFFSSATPYEKQDMKPLLASIIDFSFLEPYFSWVSFTYNQTEVSIAALGVEGFIEFFFVKEHISVHFSY